MTFLDTTKLKALETKKEQLELIRKNIINDIEENQKKSNELKQQINLINIDINELKNREDGKVVVSEHAMLRYIERVLGIDLDELNKKIINETDAKQISSLGNCTYSKDGFKLKVKNNKVITILKN